MMPFPIVQPETPSSVPKARPTEEVEVPINLAEPFTDNLLPGLVVPIPMLPPFCTTRRAVGVGYDWDPLN